DFERLNLLRAIDDDRHHPAASIPFDLQFGHLLLHAVLHLLRLLHHLLDIHAHISSTSRISAGNTSSSAWTLASAMACSRSADCLLLSLGAPGGGAVVGLLALPPSA